jgi:hypothetical protein
MTKLFLALLALQLGVTTGVTQTPAPLPPSPIANAVRICQEPCTIVSVSDKTATIFRYALGTSTGAPVGKYALKDAAAYTVVYTYVPVEPGGLQHTVNVPAFALPLTITGIVDSNGVTFPNVQGTIAATWPLPATTTTTTSPAASVKK